MDSRRLLPSLGSSVRRWLPHLWVLALGGVSVAGIVDAIKPATLIWSTLDREQDGQLVFYNVREGGGHFGLPVEIGDYDGDGQLDLVLGPMGTDSGPVGDRPLAGEVAIYRGDGKLDGNIIDRDNFSNDDFPGLTIFGARQADYLGTELFTADVNGDGIEDLLIGSQYYDGPDGDRPSCGGAFIVLGREGLLDPGAVIDLNFDPADPPPGVVTLFGERAGDRLGIWVEAGDFDGDGMDDLVVGGDLSAGPKEGVPCLDCCDDDTRVGMAAVVYGREDFPSIIDLGEGPEALAGVSFIYGRDGGDHFGACLHARDLDQDGQDELMVAASLNRFSATRRDIPEVFPASGSGGGDGPDGMRCSAGEVFIFFSGEAGTRLPPRLDLSDPLPAEIEGRLAVIYGSTIGEVAGEEMTTGDFDGDGLPELVLGALTFDSPQGLSNVGAAYVIYRADQLKGTVVDLSKLGTLPDEVRLSRLFGLKQGDILGDTLSVGDFNRDGYDDLAIGIPNSDFDLKDDVGEVAVLFGRQEPFPDDFLPSQGSVENGPLIAFVRGPDHLDNFSYSMEARDYDDDGYDDLFPNAMRGDGFKNLPNNDAGEAYVVSGFHFSGQKVAIQAIEPESATVGLPAEITVSGSGFTRAQDTRVVVGDLNATDIQVLGATEIRAVLAPTNAIGAVAVRVENRHGEATLPSGFTWLRTMAFVRGDSNGDGQVQMDDAIHTMRWMFLGDVTQCVDSHDVNDTGVVDISDPIRTLTYLFLGGPPPPPPFPEPGLDPTPDDLDCP